MRAASWPPTSRRLLHGRPAQRTFDYTPIGSLASLGHREAVAQVKGVKLAGVPAWLMWRGVYLGKLPRFSRKLQVALDWAGDLFSPAEITYLPMGAYAAARARDAERDSDARRGPGVVAGPRRSPGVA